MAVTFGKVWMFAVTVLDVLTDLEIKLKQRRELWRVVQQELELQLTWWFCRSRQSNLKKLRLMAALLLLFDEGRVKALGLWRVTGDGCLGCWSG